MRTGMKRTMVVAWAITLLMSMAVPLSAGAQERRGPRRMGGFGGPTWWVSAWGGYQWSDQVGDPGTKSTWDFDSNWSVRFTAEREAAPRTTIGAVFNYARLPLGIFGSASSASCRPRCGAEATTVQYGLMARSGGGRGFHLVYEGFVGALRYSNFTVVPAGATEYDGLTNTDFAYSFGTGIGYGLSRDFELAAMFDYGSSMHEKSNDLFQRRTTRHYATRLGLRVGL